MTERGPVCCRSLQPVRKTSLALYAICMGLIILDHADKLCICECRCMLRITDTTTSTIKCLDAKDGCTQCSAHCMFPTSGSTTYVCCHCPVLKSLCMRSWGQLSRTSIKRMKVSSVLVVHPAGSPASRHSTCKRRLLMGCHAEKLPAQSVHVEFSQDMDMTSGL